MWAVLSLITLIAIPVCAFKGKAYRGAYIALALIASMMAIVLFGVLGGAVNPNDLAQATGAAFINEYGPPTIAWLLSTAIAAVIAACLYRASQR